MVLESEYSRDAEFMDLERQSLITGEPRYTEDEIRNTTIAAILSGVAAILSLVALILVWILYARQRTKTFITHGILMSVVFIFAIVCILWALGARTSLITGRQPSSLFTLIIFLFALTCAGYCTVETIWLIYQKPIHHDYLVGVYAANKQGDRTPNWSFDDIWKQDRRMLYWICVFTLVTALCMAFVAYSAANVVWNKYQLIRYGLYFTLAMMTLAAWLMLFWTNEAYNRLNFIQDDYALFSIKAHKVLAIVALAVAFLNMIVNVVKSKIGYFIFGIACAGLFVVLICTNSALWRLVRQQQLVEYNNQASQNCQTTQYAVHQDDFGDCDYLGGKYLQNGQTCGKSNLVVFWETPNNQVVSLNPACCLYAKYVNLHPFMMLAYWGLVLTIATALSMVFNLYLADTTEYLTNANRSLGIGDFLGIFVICGLSIAWGIYFIATRKGDNSQPYSNTGYINSYVDPANNPVPNWTLVPAGLLSSSNPAANLQSTTGAVCFPYNTANLPFPTFQSTGSSCTNPNSCSIRLAIALFNGAKFNVGNVGTANRAFSDNRFVFFPQCAAANGGLSDFIEYYGTQAQIQQVLQNIQICPPSVATLPFISVYTDQVATNTINNAGLVPTDPASTSAAANQNTGQCGVGFSSASCAANANCRYTSQLTSQVVSRTLKGRFYFIANGQKRYDIPNTIQVTASDAAGSIGGLTQLFSDGIFTISGVPLYLTVPYRLRLAITDTSNTFLSSFQDIDIDPRFGTAQVSAGEIRLDTRDGTVCLPFFNTACINNQQTSRGTINAVVQSGTLDSGSSGVLAMNQANVNVLQYHVITGNSIATGTTDNNGFVTFNNLAFGPYTLITSATGFNPNAQFVDLQSPVLNTGAISLSPILPQYDAAVTANYLSTTTDYDLILGMRNLNSQDCEVSPYNKYCPYTYDVNDVTKAPGQESIIVKRLAVATYNAYVRQSPAYVANCDAQNFVQANAYHLQSFNWMHMQTTQQINILPGQISTSTLFNVNSSNVSFDQLVLNSLSPAPIVQTDAQANQAQTVIARNNAPLSTSQQYTNTTNTVAFDSGVPASIQPTGALTYANATYVTCANPPVGSTNCLNGTASANISPATTNLVITNYTITNGNLTSYISNQTNVTTFSNNQSTIVNTTIVNNTLNLTDNTTVNGTTTNWTLTTPVAGQTNDSYNTSQNITTYTNGSVVNQTYTSGSDNNTNGTISNFTFNISNMTSPQNVINLTSGFSNSTINTAVSVNDPLVLSIPTGIVNQSLIGSSPSLGVSKATQVITLLNNTNLTSNGTDYYVATNNTNYVFNIGLNLSSFTYLNITSNNTTAIYNSTINTTAITNYNTYATLYNSTNATINQTGAQNLTVSNFTVNNSYFVNNSTFYYSNLLNTANFSNTTVNFPNYTLTLSAFNVTTNNSTALQTYNYSVTLLSLIFSYNSSTSTNASADLIFNDTELTNATYNFANVTSPFSSPAGNFSWCNIVAVNNTLVYSNATFIFKLGNSTACNFTNGTLLNQTNITFVERATLANGSTLYLNNTNMTYVYTYPNGTTATFTSTGPTSTSRRLLAAEGHKQGGGTNNTPQNLGTASVTGGQYIWISCFTGYGQVSTIVFNQIQNNQPSLNDCVTQINNQRPQYSAQNLNNAVKNYNGS